MAPRGRPGHWRPEITFAGTHKLTAGASPPRHRGTTVTSTVIMGSPARRLLNPITRCWDNPHNRYAGTDDGRGTGQTLDAERLTLMNGSGKTTLLGALLGRIPLDEVTPGWAPASWSEKSTRPVSFS
jgi:hypothetical protein